MSEQKFQQIPVEQLYVPEANRSVHQTDIDGLAQSVGEVGIIEPLLVRPSLGPLGEPDRWEIVCGARRHAAAVMAGLATVPCVVRALSDDEATELRLVENVQREGLDPLDEAAAYALLAARGLTWGQIAARVGRSVAHVRLRAELEALGPDGRKALAAKQMSVGVAQLVARMPRHLQREALSRLVMESEGQDLSLVRGDLNKLLHRLTGAPFDAAECAVCPRRTGAQRELWADTSDDYCLDPKCWDKKVTADWKARVKDAKKSGIRVLDEDEARTALYDRRQFAPTTSLPKGVEAPVAAIGLIDGRPVEFVRTKDIPKPKLSRRLAGDAPALKPAAVRAAFRTVAAEICREADEKFFAHTKDDSGQQFVVLLGYALVGEVQHADRVSWLKARKIDVGDDAVAVAQEHLSRLESGSSPNAVLALALEACAPVHWITRAQHIDKHGADVPDAWCRIAAAVGVPWRERLKAYLGLETQKSPASPGKGKRGSKKAANGALSARA